MLIWIILYRDPSRQVEIGQQIIVGSASPDDVELALVNAIPGSRMGNQHPLDKSRNPN